MDLAFEKRKDAFLSIPPLASYFLALESSKNKITNSSVNIESKIRLLKELLDKKLITDEQFEIQVKESLSSN